MMAPVASILRGGSSSLMPSASILRTKAGWSLTSKPIWSKTRGRVLDHIGFDVKDHPAFVRKIEAEGIKLDEPPRKIEATGAIITYITDPWGTRIELVQRG